MQFSLRIDTQGALLSGQAPAVVQRNLTRAVTTATLLLHREVVARTPQGVFGAQGGLLGSIQQEVTGKGTLLVKGEVGSAQKYAEVIEKGRTPGKGMPPAGTLLRWLEVKLGLDARTAKRVEFVVRRKIGQKGFDGAHMFEKALEQNLPQIEAIFARAGLTITKELNGE